MDIMTCGISFLGVIKDRVLTWAIEHHSVCDISMQCFTYVDCDNDLQTWSATMSCRVKIMCISMICVFLLNTDKI